MFNPLDQSLDIEWLQANGWTVNGNLAYRHIMYDFKRDKNIEMERIEQILLQHDALDQEEKIKQALIKLIALQSDWNREEMLGIEHSSGYESLCDAYLEVKSE